MGDPVPTLAGWYPDAEAGATKYWDGSRWTGHTRPRRKPFAAASAYRGWGIALVVIGVLSVWTSPDQFNQTPADETSTISPIGAFFFAVFLGLALATFGVYLFRGRGPTTKAVEVRVAAENEAANLRRVARPRSVSVNVAGPTSSDAAEAARINAIVNPETARALQGLDNLRYTQILTDAEVQAAKDILLGIGKREGAGMPAGWHDDGSGRLRWWDGQQWTSHFHHERADHGNPLISLESEIAGESATVEIYNDRVGWVRKRGVSPKKITAGILTGGASLAVTGVGKGSYGVGGTTGSETVWMTAITRVTSAKDRSRTVVSITTPSGVVPMRLKHEDAAKMMHTLNLLIANASRDGAPVVVQVTTPAMVAAPAAPSTAAPDPYAQIAKLAELRRAGVLSEEEFAAAKAKALGL